MNDRSTSERLEPIRKKVLVAASPEVAFRRFTAEIGDWWPLPTHSVEGADAESVAFGEDVGGSIVERGPAGESVWGSVTDWDPPRRVAFTWHPGRPASTAQEVTVTFLSTGEATEVTLVHGGWEALGDQAAEEREAYDTGWDHVLALYQAAV